jgi:hypothetical protein
MLPRKGRPVAVTGQRRATGGLGLLAAAGSLIAAQGAMAQAPAAVLPAASASLAVARVGVATAVAGIIGYTRWPAESLPLRLCTLGRSPWVDELLQGAELGSAQRPVTVRSSGSTADALRECQAIYVGQLDAAAWRALLAAVIGRPVLLLGEGAAFCTDGGMFCLEPGSQSGPQAVRFNANLDAIARSGLRVNPLVLRIARSPVGSGS